jgi:hypothetical protein
LETISSIHEVDTTALDRIEAERADERRRAGEAANAAIRRAAVLHIGLGIGAAATGAGLGLFLVLYGVSLLIDRPTLDRVAAAMREQVVVADRLAREREEAVRQEATARVARAEANAAASAQAQRLAEEKADTAEKAAAANAAATKEAEDRATAIAGIHTLRRKPIALLDLVYRETGWKARSHTTGGGASFRGLLLKRSAYGREPVSRTGIQAYLQFECHPPRHRS